MKLPDLCEVNLCIKILNWDVQRKNVANKVYKFKGIMTKWPVQYKHETYNKKDVTDI